MEKVVFIPVRYGQILGVYVNQDDALQVVNLSIQKNQPCDLIIKPIIYPLNEKHHGK